MTQGNFPAGTNKKAHEPTQDWDRQRRHGLGESRLGERTRYSQPIIDDVHTPSIIRCEAEQLVVHEFIKALSNLKHTMVALLSSSIRQNTSPKKEEIVVHLAGNLSCHQKLKFKSHEQVLKLVWNMLTKKYIIVTKYNKFSALTYFACCWSFILCLILFF
jgi:hypothetical protein